MVGEEGGCGGTWCRAKSCLDAGIVTRHPGIRRPTSRYPIPDTWIQAPGCGGLCMAVVAVDGAPGGGLQAAGGGTRLGLYQALAAIVVLAWLLPWVGVPVG